MDDLLTRPQVAIVGSRKVTPYGRQVTEKFAGELAGHGVVIVSGLAYGVDSIAHQAALDAGSQTIAVLPSSLSRVYPSAHIGLAQRIIEQGGALLTEYSIGSDIAYKNQFVERNRIVSGISHVLLITEAAKDSGTMHTAQFALDQGKDILAVPGNITSPSSEGTNNLLRKPTAVPATSVDDVLNLLHLQSPPKETTRGGSSREQVILDIMNGGISEGQALLSSSLLSVKDFNQAMTMMEITGKIRALGANHWAIR